MHPTARDYAFDPDVIAPKPRLGAVVFVAFVFLAGMCLGVALTIATLLF